jgi:hypothetical protein
LHSISRCDFFTSKQKGTFQLDYIVWAFGQIKLKDLRLGEPFFGANLSPFIHKLPSESIIKASVLIGVVAGVILGITIGIQVFKT